MTKQIRVLIADDHAVVRDGIRRILEDEADVDVVGEARDGREAVAKARELSPNVVIMDVSMPDVNGLTATREIKAQNPETQVLGLTVYETPDYFFSMLEAGAAGYLLKKDATSEELMTAIRAVHGEGVYLPPTVAKWLIRDRLGLSVSSQKRKPTEEELTAREEEILKLVAEGLSTQAIADKAHISPATVHTHRSNIMQKLGLHSRIDLVKYALSRGFIQLKE